MNVEIIDTPLILEIYGFYGIATGKNYAGTAFSLSDKMWKVVRANGLKNKGGNIWVYEPDEKVFAGIELDEIPKAGVELEQNMIQLAKYAYYKHIGPYTLIKQAGQYMSNEIKRKGYQTSLPYIEIYGHWTPDELKLETELFMRLA